MGGRTDRVCVSKTLLYFLENFKGLNGGKHRIQMTGKETCEREQEEGRRKKKQLQHLSRGNYYRYAPEVQHLLKRLLFQQQRCGSRTDVSNSSREESCWVQGAGKPVVLILTIT